VLADFWLYFAPDGDVRIEPPVEYRLGCGFYNFEEKSATRMMYNAPILGSVERKH
jgi:hypothetical protein